MDTMSAKGSNAHDGSNTSRCTTGGPSNQQNGSENVASPNKSTEVSLAVHYRRASFVAGTYGRPSLLSSSPGPRAHLAPAEIDELANEERFLIREAKHQSLHSKQHSATEHIPPIHTESTPLLVDNTTLEAEWEDAVKDECIKSSYRHEFSVLVNYSTPLIITFLLQASEQFSSVFSLGHLGSVELGSASLSTALAAITWFSVASGVITSLDTLCAQAYGSGRTELVGIHVQRCLLLLAILLLPVIYIWLNTEALLLALSQDPEVARLSGQYMKVFLLGAPGFAIFETLKRFLQAQGLMAASTYVLLVSAPINIMLNYVLVWDSTVGFGFLGAPTAVVITYWLQTFLLIAYIRFVDGKDAWKGFSYAAFKNWGPMLRLAVPGVIMVASEWGAFEITALAASYLGTNELAAQSVLNTTASILFQVPFGVSVAVSTRVGNLLGSQLGTAAQTACHVALSMASAIAVVTSIGLFIFRKKWGFIFSDEEEVVRLVSDVIPLLSIFEIFDCLGAIVSGILRGQGRQAVGAVVNIPSYYLVGIPAGLALTFAKDLGLVGIWLGMMLALFLVAVIEITLVLRTDWPLLVTETTARLERDDNACT